MTRQPVNSTQEIETYRRAWAILDALAANPTLSMNEITQQIERGMRQALEFDHLCIWLLTKLSDQDVLRPVTCGDRVRGMVDELALGQGLVGWVAERGIPLRVGDVLDDPRYVIGENTPTTLSALVAPLKIGAQTIGALSLASARADGFDAADEQTLALVAPQLAASIQNARLHQGTQRRLDEVSLLHQWAQRINTSLDIREVLESIVWSLKETMQCRGCSIALLDPVEATLEIHTAAGVEPKWEDTFKLRLGEGIAGRVALEGRPIYVPDAYQVEGFIFFDPSVRSLLTVPLTIQQRVIGTLSVDSNQPNAFSQDDEQLLTIAAAQAAVAIENARLYASLERRAQKLAEAYAELKQADRAKDEIVQNVSHELRMPLTYIKSYVELLLDESAGAITEEQSKYLKIVAEKTNAVARLVGDIMALQHAEQPPSKLTSVSLANLARQAVRGCALVAQKAGLSVVEKIPDSLPPVAGDEVRLLQVIDNLLSNAIKFSPNGGQITIAAQDAGPVVELSVADQGIGIPKAERERIFDRFYQIDGTARRRFGGAGLGLAIAKRIVEAHAGKIWVDSEPGQGSTFYVHLPKYQDPRI